MIKLNKSHIFTDKEIKVVEKKMLNRKLNQTDSNYLSRFIRPKLREIEETDAKMLMNRIEYSHKARWIEQKIRKAVLTKFKEVDTIVIFGSAIQMNYKEYKDIDVLVIVKKKSWRKLFEKHEKIRELRQELKNKNINSHLQLIDKKSFYKAYPYNISLVYQLKDRKIIYGKLRLPKKIEIFKKAIEIKLDYSILEDKNSEGIEIYKALRNLFLARLLMNKIIDNNALNKKLIFELGENIIKKLKSNKETRIEKLFALSYLQEMLNLTLKQLKSEKWEKIVLSNY